MIKNIVVFLLLVTTPSNIYSQIESSQYFDTTKLSHELLSKTISDYLSDESVFGHYSKFFIMSDISASFSVNSMCNGTILDFAFSNSLQLNDSVIISSKDINQLITDKSQFKKKIDKKLISSEHFKGLVYSKNRALRIHKRTNKLSAKRMERISNKFYIKKSISREEYEKGVNKILANTNIYFNINFPVFNNDMTLSLVYVKTSSNSFDAVYFWKKETNKWSIIYKMYCNIITI